MSFDIVEKSLEWIAATANKKVEIVFIGGEPTLEADKIEYAVHYASRIGAEKGIQFQFTMTSNFLNIDNDLAKKLAEWKVSYLLSVDGYGERHDRSRPAKDKRLTSPFSLLQERMTMLKTYQPRMAARVTSIPATVNWLRDDLQKLFELGFDHFIISPATGIQWKPEEMKRFGREITQYALQRNIYNGKARPYISPVDDADKGKFQWGCGAGRGRFAINPEGHIHACARFTGMTSIDSLALGDVQNGIIPEGNIKKFQDRTYQSRMICLTCSIREECLGGCPAINWEESGSLVIPSPSECSLMKTFAKVKHDIKTHNNLKKEAGYG